MEIVEQEVERVLPGSSSAFWFVKNSAFWLVNKFLAFRAAMHCELLKEDEVKLLLQDRKREEAKLVKREAQKDDFINFVARDSIMLKLLQKRRKSINYTHKMAEIEYVFLQGGFIIFQYYNTLTLQLLSIKSSISSQCNRYTFYIGSKKNFWWTAIVLYRR